MSVYPYLRREKKLECAKKTISDFKKTGSKSLDNVKKFLCNDITILTNDLCVIADEFSELPKLVGRHSDILCIDSELNPVLVKIRRDKSEKLKLLDSNFQKSLNDALLKFNFDLATKMLQQHAYSFWKYTKEEYGVVDAKKEILEFLAKDEPTIKTEFENDRKVVNFLVAPQYDIKMLETLKKQTDDFKKRNRLFQFAPIDVGEQKFFEINEVNLND